MTISAGLTVLLVAVCCVAVSLSAYADELSSSRPSLVRLKQRDATRSSVDESGCSTGRGHSSFYGFSSAQSVSAQCGADDRGVPTVVVDARCTSSNSKLRQMHTRFFNVDGVTTKVECQYRNPHWLVPYSATVSAQVRCQRQCKGKKCQQVIDKQHWTGSICPHSYKTRADAACSAPNQVLSSFTCGWTGSEIERRKYFEEEHVQDGLTNAKCIVRGRSRLGGCTTATVTSVAECMTNHCKF